MSIYYIVRILMKDAAQNESPYYLSVVPDMDPNRQIEDCLCARQADDPSDARHWLWVDEAERMLRLFMASLADENRREHYSRVAGGYVLKAVVTTEQVGPTVKPGDPIPEPAKPVPELEPMVVEDPPPAPARPKHYIDVEGGEELWKTYNDGLPDDDDLNYSPAEDEGRLAMIEWFFDNAEDIFEALRAIE